MTKEDKKNIKPGDFTFTKMRLIYEPNNDMVHNYYWCYDVRHFVTDKSFYRYRFVRWFDIQDVCDYYGKDRVTKKEIREYAAEIGMGFFDTYCPKTIEGGRCAKEDIIKCRKACSETIENYNRLIRAAA